jgi:hypothetical protein
MRVHPNLLPKISVDEYYQLHRDYIVPLDLKIDVSNFNSEINQYKSNFRQWGIEHTEYPRFGISLCNLSGRIDDVLDPACYPLDRWAVKYPSVKFWDHDFKKITPVFELPSLSPLHQFRQHLIRSNILLWHNTGHFKPHSDTDSNLITHIRLWGVNVDDSKYKLKYNDHIVKNFEPGRLYLIDTIKQHEAFALADDVYTFFIAVNLTALPLIKNLIL